MAFDYYAEYLPHQKKFDLLGMTKHGVLRIPPEMVDPVNRHILALQTNIAGFAYNKKLVPEKKTARHLRGHAEARIQGKKICHGRPAQSCCRARAGLGGWRKWWLMPNDWRPKSPSGLRGDTRTLPLL